MNDSALFKLQIVDRLDRVLMFPGGGQVEVDLVQAVAAKVAQKVSMVTTRGKAQAAVAEAVSEVVYSLKKETVKFL